MSGYVAIHKYNINDELVSFIITMTQLVGYIGALLLICRFLPMLRDQINNTRPVNMYFIIIEAGASICLGISAVLLHAYPFIIANAFSLLTTVFIICLHIYREYWGKREAATLNMEMSAIEMSEVEV